MVNKTVNHLWNTADVFVSLGFSLSDQLEVEVIACDN